MNDTNPIRSEEKRFSAHRLILLASAASVAVALVVGGPSGNGVLNSLVAPALAATDTHAPAGFADVVAKVKPAVISVKVKIEQTAQTMSMQGDDEGDTIPLPPGFEKNFRQFGFGGMPKGMPQGKHMVTGEGSGFFISANGYAVTNNHVVDHAKTVQVHNR
jgi:serine protease Do